MITNRHILDCRGSTGSCTSWSANCLSGFRFYEELYDGNCPGKTARKDRTGINTNENFCRVESSGSYCYVCASPDSYYLSRDKSYDCTCKSTRNTGHQKTFFSHDGIKHTIFGKHLNMPRYVKANGYDRYSIIQRNKWGWVNFYSRYVDGSGKLPHKLHGAKCYIKKYFRTGHWKRALRDMCNY